jgi:carbon storage regulator
VVFQIKEEYEMLVLSRKCGEAIVIADNITVTVLAVQGNRVKLGFVAPGDAPIHRAEIFEQIEHRLPFGAYAEAALG